MTPSQPQWLVITYRIDAGLTDVVSNSLAAIGFSDYTLSSRSDRQWDLVCYGRDGQVPDALRQCLDHLRLISEVVVDEQQLIAAADDSLPVSLCNDVLVIPEDPADHEPPPIAIHLGRGPAFGDGRHPTTRSAARLMRPFPWSGHRVWDVGAGSGILGVLALRLGAEDAVFGDIDADARRTCLRTCALNGYTDAPVIHCDLLDGFTSPSPTVIIANIYAELVAELLVQPALAEHLPHGTLFLSGISHQKVAMIRERLQARGFTITAEEHEEWWHALQASR